MKPNPIKLTTMTVPLGLEAHSQAEQFLHKHRNPTKAKQVYLNTLAIFAVKFYLRCMEIETDWQASLSSNPLMQGLMDIADLQVPGFGILECRPVLPNAQTIDIPIEVCSDRIAYVAVQFNESLRDATLLGFVPTAINDRAIAINELRTLEDFLIHLHQIKERQSVRIETYLSQWLQNLFEVGWQSIEDIFGEIANERKFAYRSVYSGEASVARAKLINLGVQLGGKSVALLIAIAPYTEQKVEVLVQIHPVGGEAYLPADLRLNLLAQTGELLQGVQSRNNDNYIQLKRFRGDSGENFGIQVSFGNVIMTENFVI